MPIPTFAQSQVYKSRDIRSQIRAAVEIDYPVFSGHFEDDFNGIGLPDSTKWFIFNPSWGMCTQWVGALWLGTNVDAISPSWVQSRHCLAFPRRLDTDWTFQVRAAANPTTGFGSFIRICGRSFRDAEAIVGIHANTASGLVVHAPDGYTADAILWNPGVDLTFNRYRVRYDAGNQNYIIDIDADDDGTYEIGPFTVAVNGRYADALVLGNSTAIQGHLGAWTQWHIDWVDIVGTAETVEIPPWAAPFDYNGERFAYLPSFLGGRTSVDRDNIVDAAEVRLANIGYDEQMSEIQQMYTFTRFWNRRAFIEARAGDGAGNWAPWQTIFQGLCAEKQIETSNTGGTLVLPLRDRYRAIADDMLILACYSDAAGVIPGVGMNMTVAEIIEDLYQQRCGLPAAAMNVVATPNNTPRNYNVYRRSGQQSVRQLCEDTALDIRQRLSDARIEVQEWPWGDGVADYIISTAEELRRIGWTQSAFDVYSGEQLSFENTEWAGGSFTHTWPPHREPFYGRLTHSNAVSCEDSASHDLRPVACLKWWARNRKLGSILAESHAQFWVELDQELGVRDSKWLGIRDKRFIVDGIEHNWQEDMVASSRLRLIDPEFWRFIRENLMP